MGRPADFAERGSVMRRLACFTIVLSVCLLSPLSSHAQFGGTSNAGGASRTGSMGAGGAGGGGGLNGGGFGGSSMGGQGGGFGGQAGGQGGAFGGQAGGAGGAFGGQAGATGANGMNNQQGQGFLGRNTNQNQFLGRNLQGQGQNGGAQTGAGNRRVGGNRGGNNQNNMMNNQQGQGGMGGAAKAPVVIRARQKIAFEHTAPHLPTVSVKLETRLNKMTALKSSNLNLSVGSAGELVLKGEVANSEQAKLAENLARLEPGVRTVRNELTFPEAAPGN